MAEQKVIRVARSPMNPKQWCCDLACGHEKWVTAARKPTRKTLNCDKCKESA